MKNRALEIMRNMEIFEPMIDAFEKNNEICIFENYIGFLAEEKEILDKIKELEKDKDCLVYAITHDYTNFGELYSFLLVVEDSPVCTKLKQCNFRVYAYVWNKSKEWCSEYGNVLINTFGGGIRRIV